MARLLEQAVLGEEMTVDDVRQRTRVKLEQLLGAEEASWLMDRPPGGWSDLVTNQTLDLKLSALEDRVGRSMTELSASVDQRLRAQTWITTTTLVAGLALAFTAGRLG
jgi:hypothetical protein